MKRRELKWLLLPVVLLLVLGLVLRNKEAANDRLMRNMIGKWISTSGGGTVMEFEKGGTATVSWKNGRQFVRRVRIDGARIILDEPTQRGVVVADEKVEIAGDEMTITNTEGEQSPVVERFKRLNNTE